MVIALFLVVLVLILGLVALLLSLRGTKRYSWLEYYMKAREAGLSLKDARALKDAGALAKLRDPTNVLGSTGDLDKAMAVLASRQKAEGKDRTKEGTAFMERVYAFRKALEFQQPRYKLGIESSKMISQGQRVRVLVPGAGVFGSTVVDNHQRYLVLSYPAGGALPPKWVWQGKKVSLYFWRRDDAGYVFDSYVLDDLRIRNVPVLHIAHSEALLRTQKRKSVRARSRIPAYLYLLKRIEGAFEKAETKAGLRSLIQDISEDGVAVAIGGRARPGLSVKVQFALGDRGIVMSGKVKSVDYDAVKNRSVLHVEAIRPSPRTREAIRAFVYRTSSNPRLAQGETTPQPSAPYPIESPAD
jgi:c-di-GMP-binding flagellar brake protein YcgR